MFASGSLLSQVRPSGTSAVTAFTATSATKRIEITRIVVCNTTAVNESYSIYHHDTGTTYDQTTALFYTTSVPAYTTVMIDSPAGGVGITVKSGGAIGVKTSTANALTFSLYGVTEGRL
jgi:hypothetical protein